jgi:hypothetical protein
MEPYKTSDTPFAAFLHYHKHQLVSLRKDPNDVKRRVYIFIKQEITPELEKEYYTGEPQVNPGIYYRAIRTMYRQLREYGDKNEN